MIVGCPKEIKNNENRVGLTPGGVWALKQAGHTVLVERSAGAGSHFSDDEYAAKGAEIVDSARRGLVACAHGGQGQGAAAFGVRLLPR